MPQGTKGVQETKVPREEERWEERPQGAGWEGVSSRCPSRRASLQEEMPDLCGTDEEDDENDKNGELNGIDTDEDDMDQYGWMPRGKDEE